MWASVGLYRLNSSSRQPERAFVAVAQRRGNDSSFMPVSGKCNASVRFLFIEPLLEDIGALDLTGTHWVIVGRVWHPCQDHAGAMGAQRPGSLP